MKLQAVATIVVITRNRSEELIRCLRSCQIQQTPHELIVIDDASDDGTPEVVREMFPHAKLIIEPKRCNYISLRNKAARLASCDIIVSLDDDAEFSSPGVLASAVAAFKKENIGSIGIPFINVRIDPKKIINRAPDLDHCWVASRFTGTAYAVRRKVFLELGGFDESFIHRGEEMDYCLRQLRSGYINALGHGEPIFHYVSPRREPRMIAYFDARNGLRHCLKNYPARSVPIYSIAWSVNTLRHAFFISKTNRLAAIKGLLDGFASGIMNLRNRDPIKRPLFRLYEKTRRHGPLKLRDFEPPFEKAIQ